MRQPHAIRTLVRPILLVAVAAAAVMGSVPTAQAAGTSQVDQWPAHPGWDRYVVAPQTADVGPARIISTHGTVTGADTLAHGGVGRATLTMAAGGPTPSIVVDYGQDVGGVPYFVVRSVSRSPVLSAAYSEGLQYLGRSGDAAGSASPAGDASRLDRATIAYPGTLSTGLLQGGERYERISLISPGTVTLSSVGIRFTPVRATTADYRGWFDSSSPQLNRIWYDGAYTTQLDELPADSVPTPWTITTGALESAGGGVGILGQGLTWADYTMSFDARVVNQSAGWLVRAPSSSSGYLFLLRDAAHETGSPDTLSEVAIGPGEFAPIGNVVLPRTFNAGLWHDVSTVVSGTRITTSLDGRPVAAFDTNSQPKGTSVYQSGSVGFANLGGVASFRNLKVTSPSGATLYANALSQSSALSDFSGPDITTADPLPVIVDGAKRDRVVWSGDLGVEIPNVFYTTGAANFVQGSLELLASYQVADGESGTNINPTSPLATFPQGGTPYSAAYSMDEVDNIATYYLYAGDRSFVRAEWPMITRELAYDQSMVDSRGLLATDGTNGQDWDYYDGNKTGEVTAYNDLYYRTLLSAASLANSLGFTDQANSYLQGAAQLRADINRYLFDPTENLYILSTGKPTAIAQDANSLAVLFGIAPTSKTTSILAALTKALPTTPYGPMSYTSNAGYRAAVSPFVTNEEVEALFTTGDSAAAMSLISRLWGHMDAPGPDYTAADWELVGKKGSPGFGAETSLAHGWASGATADLSAYVLGVEPSTAGFSTWSVQPHPGSLAWVEGDVPTPHGTIKVRWAQNRSSGRFTMQVTAPPGTRGTIWVPVPRSGAAVRVNTTGGNQGPQTRRFLTERGSTSLPVTASGGRTYDIDAVPRSI